MTTITVSSHHMHMMPARLSNNHTPKNNNNHSLFLGKPLHTAAKNTANQDHPVKKSTKLPQATYRKNEQPDFSPLPSAAPAGFALEVPKATPKQINQPFKCNIRGREFILIRDRFFQQVFAVENNCPHRGAGLHLGLINEGTLRCFNHGKRFEIPTGNCLDNPMLCLKIIPLEEDNRGMLWLTRAGIQGVQQGAKIPFQDVDPKLRWSSPLRIPVAAKAYLIIDNAQDPSHLNPVHGLNDVEYQKINKVSPYFREFPYSAIPEKNSALSGNEAFDKRLNTVFYNAAINFIQGVLGIDFKRHIKLYYHPPYTSLIQINTTSGNKLEIFMAANPTSKNTSEMFVVVGRNFLKNPVIAPFVDFLVDIIVKKNIEEDTRVLETNPQSHDPFFNTHEIYPNQNDR